MSKTVIVYALLVGSVGVFAGCGGGGGASCAVGAEGCPCTGGGACNTGLTCASNRCVNLSGNDGGATPIADSSVSADGSSTADTGAGGAGGTDPNVACAESSKWCAKYNECIPLVLKIVYGSVEQCTARVKLQCLDAFKAPDSGLTAAALTSCANALTAASCDDVLYRKVPACQIKGTRTNGGACGTDEQCMTGHCGQNQAACGVCAGHVGAGASCIVDNDCEPGLVCSDDARCVLPSAAGTACSATQPCKLGLYCRNGSCVTTVSTPGGACQDIAASCDQYKGVYCNTTVNTCATYGYAAPGEPCGVVASKWVVCSPGDCIFATASDSQGICAAPAADGAACGDESSNNKGCMAPARCVANRCKLPSSAACL